MNPCCGHVGFVTTSCPGGTRLEWLTEDLLDGNTIRELLSLLILLQGGTVTANLRGSMLLSTGSQLMLVGFRAPETLIKRKEKKTVAQLWGLGITKVVKVLQAGRQLLELENSGAALVDAIHESMLHSQLLPTI